MISFASDYIAGAHPVIMQRLLETNMENLSGYGTDQYCAQAKEKIKQAFQCPDGEVFFLVGGTQTNQVIISTMLAPYEGVIAAKTGHVSVHEAGAIEYSGHKVIELDDQEYIALITVEDLESDDEEGALLLYRYNEDPEDPDTFSLDNIETDEEYETVTAVLDEILEDEE